MSVLTAERLVRLAHKYPSLQNSWFLIACACLTVINQPQEIARVYHYALRQQLLEFKSDKSLMSDPHMLRLAEDSISSSEKYEELDSIGINLPHVLIPYNYYDKLPSSYKFSKSADIEEFQSLITLKFRETILKIAALSGVPKSINAMNILKRVTPTTFRSSNLYQRQNIVSMHDLPSSKIIEEDFSGTSFQNDEVIDTIDGPINLNSINSKQIFRNLQQGSNLWNSIYTTKVNKKIKNQLYTSYPDLWLYVYQNVYSNLLGFTKILNEKETCMCIVTSLIPQDVNPQLKGHLKGALNVGVTHEQLNDIRAMVFDLCDWTGGITWKGGKESVAKL